MDLTQAFTVIDRASDNAAKMQSLDEESLAALQFIWATQRRKEVRSAIEAFLECFTWSDNAMGRSQCAIASRNRIRLLMRAKR